MEADKDPATLPCHGVLTKLEPVCYHFVVLCLPANEPLVTMIIVVLLAFLTKDLTVIFPELLSAGLEFIMVFDIVCFPPFLATIFIFCIPFSGSFLCFFAMQCSPFLDCLFWVFPEMCSAFRLYLRNAGVQETNHFYFRFGNDT